MCVKFFSRLFRKRTTSNAGRNAEIAVLRKSPFFDEAWYRETYPDLKSLPIDMARHYLDYGATEGRDPGPDFYTDYYLAQNPDVAATGTNALIHYILQGSKNGRPAVPPASVSGGKSYKQYQAELAEVVASQFDREFYLHSNPDVAASGIDPLNHFCNAGWREGRDPAPWFSTRHYLGQNKSVADSFLNPFWHYIVFGKAEGRTPEPETNAQINLLRNLASPPRPVLVEDENVELISPAAIRAGIEKAIVGSLGVVISFSHTDYLSISAGTELFIAQEQRAFTRARWAYLHFSPEVGSHYFLGGIAEANRYRLIVDGQLLGMCLARELVDVFRDINTASLDNRVLAIHSILGQSADVMLSLIAAFSPTQSYFWTHDYSGICSGYNLLRNNVQYCAAPPQTSGGCGICIYGESRLDNAAQLERLFEAANFTVVAPSTAARDVWVAGSSLPVRDVLIVEHCQFAPKSDGIAGRPLERNDLATYALSDSLASALPLKVAYVGQRAAHKGWPLFQALRHRLHDDDAYSFFYFGKTDALPPSRRLRAVDVNVTLNFRDAMTRALWENKIEVVVLASPWPETYSYVAFEALAAGCQIVTVAASGNIAATVNKLGRGIVLKDDNDLISYFADHRALNLRQSTGKRPRIQELTYCGTTASIVFPGMSWSE